MLHLPRRLVNRFRRSPQERLGVLFVLAALLLFWLVVIGLDIFVRVTNSAVIK
jgi:hypothetical protein